MNMPDNEVIMSLNRSGYFLLMKVGGYVFLLALLYHYWRGSLVVLRFVAAVIGIVAALFCRPHVLGLFPELDNTIGQQFVLLALIGGFVAIAHQMINKSAAAKLGGGI
jgi:hypothetical protein